MLKVPNVVPHDAQMCFQLLLFAFKLILIFDFDFFFGFAFDWTLHFALILKLDFSVFCFDALLILWTEFGLLSSFNTCLFLHTIWSHGLCWCGWWHKVGFLYVFVAEEVAKDWICASAWKEMIVFCRVCGRSKSHVSSLPLHHLHV